MAERDGDKTDKNSDDTTENDWDECKKEAEWTTGETDCESADDTTCSDSGEDVIERDGNVSCDSAR